MKYLIFLSLLLFSSCTYYIGPNRWAKSFNDAPIIVPNQQKAQLPISVRLELGDEIIQKTANQNIEKWSDKFNDTIVNVRPIIANLLLNQNVDAMNQLILKYKAWGTTGTSSKVNPKGDYDFTQIQWAQLLCLFQNKQNVLYPETQQHIIDHLIIDNGNKPDKKAPKTMGIVRETENHILMKEGSRYLKNQWLYQHKNDEQYNNAANGMDEFLLAHLNEMSHTGLFEFNSNPYGTYTFETLYILNNHIENTAIKAAIQQILDTENWSYALGSYQFKRFPPFRRRLSRFDNHDIFADRQTPFAQALVALNNNQEIKLDMISCCHDRLLPILTGEYTLAHHSAQMVKEKPFESYYVQIGHGLKGSPEIYSGQKDYLISAGGLRFGFASQIVPRPITLFVNDDAQELAHCFHIPGKGSMLKWNNTGVYRNLAVGEQQVEVPNSAILIEKNGNWELYEHHNNYVLLFQAKDFGLMYIAKSIKEASAIQSLNNKMAILNQFQFIDETTIRYKVNAKKKWVITHINGEKTKRKFKNWDRIRVGF